MKSLKSKLILVISTFVVGLLSVSALLQVREESRALTQDIFVNARSFAELTAANIVDDYKTYLIPESFVYFNREIEDVFVKNSDVERIRVAKYSGELLYDSASEGEEQYSGAMRQVESAILKEQLKSQNLSVLSESSDRVVYFKKEDQGFEPVDFNEQSIEDLGRAERIDYIVQPVENEFAVIYDLTYEALQERIAATQFRILLFAVFGVSIGIIMAIVFGSGITRPLKILTKGAQILATGNLKHRVEVKTKDETRVLADSFNKMAAELEESTKALVYKERVGKELELAKDIQNNLIPKKIPQAPGIELSAGIIPAEEIGGDCYDFLPVDDNNMLMYLGDVTGHGVPSGIVVSIANALFYTFAGKMPMDEVLAMVNRVLKKKTTASMFLTLVLLNWDSANQKMTYVSAGHEQIIQYKAATGQVGLLPAGGLALGMIEDNSKTLIVREINFEPGDVLVLYSDGIPEAWQDEKHMYGMERFQQMVAKYGNFDTAMAIRNALLADVYMFRQGYKQMDDITSIVIKRKMG